MKRQCDACMLLVIRENFPPTLSPPKKGEKDATDGKEITTDGKEITTDGKEIAARNPEEVTIALVYAGIFSFGTLIGLDSKVPDTNDLALWRFLFGLEVKQYRGSTFSVD